jgi:hypothetical protein
MTLSTPCRRPRQGAVINPCDNQFSNPPFPRATGRGSLGYATRFPRWTG